MEPCFDINKLHQEAQNRWLKPLEVQFILQNYESYQISEKPPHQPPSGTLLLYNRRVLRYYRKDGHMWQRKRDGRAGGDAHERLKIGNADALSCYYAHGELNPNFQRRSYWLLDEAFSHIVLVHYLDIEGKHTSRSNLSLDSRSTLIQASDSTLHQACEPCTSSQSPESVEVTSKSFIRNNQVNNPYSEDGSENSARLSQAEVNQALRRLTMQLSLDEDDDDEDNYDDYNGEKHLAYPSQELNYLIMNNKNMDFAPANKIGGLSHGELHTRCDENTVRQDQSSCTMLLQDSDSSPLSNTSYIRNAENMICGSDVSFNTRNPDASSKDILFSPSDNGTSSEHLYNQPEGLMQQQIGFVGNNLNYGHNDFNRMDDLQHRLLETRNFLLGTDEPNDSPSADMQPTHCDPAINSSRSYSLEGILSKEINNEWMSNGNLSVDDKLFSSDYAGMLFDQNQYMSSFGVNNMTVANKQLFRIREVIPEWAFCPETAKVIIMGDFLCAPSNYSWAVMFGDVEVPIEIVQEGVLCCQAPKHDPGMVTFCITTGNREACSEIKEFEYFAKPESSRRKTLQVDSAKGNEELLLLARFAQTLLCENDGKVAQTEYNNKVESNPSRLLKTKHDESQRVIDTFLPESVNHSDITNWVLEELLKDKLQSWLLVKHRENETTRCILSKQEQRVIHIISGLGYEWALNPVMNAGVGINFRDVRGWTALHWAAHFGREKMVAALLAAGASAGAVTDPTSNDPVGKTAASIAAISGHIGLAGYLSEMELNAHLSSLDTKESENSKASSTAKVERDIGSVSESSVQLNTCATQDQLSMKDSLSAVRSATLAAARIQSAFRAHSFRKRQQGMATSCNECKFTPEEVHGLVGASRHHRVFHGTHDQNFHIAAQCIQKKFRGWKGRKTYMAIRHHIVKLQAHIRGHQVRKKYRFEWTVSMVEKVILRWRKKGVGLRGFRAETDSVDEISEDEFLKAFRKKKVDAALDESVSRVLSMAGSAEARQQYCRMLESYRKAKAKALNSGEAEPSFSKVGDEFMDLVTLDEVWANIASAEFKEV